MTMTKQFGLLTILIAATAAAASAAPLAVFDEVERLDKAWPRTMVTYQVDFKPGQAQAGKLQLVDGEGNAAPFQLWAMTKHDDGSVAAARCSFFAELAPKGSYHYELVAGNSTADNDAAPQVQSTDDALTLANKETAIRLLPVGEQTFDEPVPLPEAPAPVLGVQLANGQWVGGSRFDALDDTPPQVVSYTSRVTEQGPLFAEAEVAYELTNSEFYRMTVRVIRDDAAVRMDEQWDFKRTGPQLRYQFVMLLNDAEEGKPSGQWSPDRLIWIAVKGGADEMHEGLRARLTELGFPTDDFEPSPNFGSRAIAPTEKTKNLLFLTPNYHWNPASHYFGLMSSPTLEGDIDKEKTPFLAVVPMHSGNWRAAHGVYSKTVLQMQPDGRVELHWPLQVGGEPGDYTQTGEDDPELPFTYARRQWALVAGGLNYHAAAQEQDVLEEFGLEEQQPTHDDGLFALRSYEGFINLDDYKEWVLDWPADAAKQPGGLLFTQKEFDEILAASPDHPGREALETLLFADDNKQQVGEKWGRAIAGLAGQTRQFTGHGGPHAPTGQRLPWIVGYRQTTHAAWANGADALLMSEHLTDEQKADLRARIAAIAYLVHEPDGTRRGTMQHLGTPNMPINRFNAATFAAALLPDHPMHDEWMELSADYLQYKLGLLTAPGGAWAELVTYYEAGALHLVQAAAVLDHAGYLDDDTAEQVYQLASFLTHMMSTDDARFGQRYTPNWGHGGWGMATPYLLVAGIFRDKNPEYAQTMLWTWDQLGRVMTNMHDIGFSQRAVLFADRINDMPKDYVPPSFKSRWIPGFGAVMRAHVGTEDELFLGYRQGYQRSHVDANQGDFILYDRGSPLLTISLQQYAIHNQPYNDLHRSFGWYNHIRTGDMNKVTGNPQRPSQVQSYAFGEDADYVRGEYHLNGQEAWGRQMMLLKSIEPGGIDHVLIRDSFTGRGEQQEATQPKYWYLRTLGEAERIERNQGGFTYRSPWGEGRLSVHLLSPDKFELTTKAVTTQAPLYNHPALRWKEMGNPVVGDGKAVIAETTSVTAVGPVAPEHDILAALVPYREGEKLPEYTRLAEGVVSAKTPQGMDYLFLSGEPFEAEADGITFQGKAGAVRLRDEAVHLIITEGPGQITYQGMTLVSEGPAEHIVPRAELKKTQTIAVPAAKHDIAFALDPAQGAIEEVEPGVKRQTLSAGFAYHFDSSEPLTFETDEAIFHGRRGGIVVNESENTVRLVMLDGERIEQGAARVNGAGPYDLTFHPERIAGRTFGEQGRFVVIPKPEAMHERVTLVVDGLPWVPGRFGAAMVVPIMPGAHEMELRTLKQPRVPRNWQAWPAKAE